MPAEYDLIREDQIVFTLLHLAAAEELTHALIKSKSINMNVDVAIASKKTGLGKVRAKPVNN